MKAQNWDTLLGQWNSNIPSEHNVKRQYDQHEQWSQSQFRRTVCWVVTWGILSIILAYILFFLWDRQVFTLKLSLSLTIVYVLTSLLCFAVSKLITEATKPKTTELDEYEQDRADLAAQLGMTNEEFGQQELKDLQYEFIEPYLAALKAAINNLRCHEYDARAQSNYDRYRRLYSCAGKFFEEYHAGIEDIEQLTVLQCFFYTTARPT